MTVRSIVEMFESMATSAGGDSPARALESPGRGNVCGLVTYYDGLAVVEEPPMPVAAKTVRLVLNQSASNDAEPHLKEAKEEEDSHTSNQDVNEALAVSSTSLHLSKIPQPKSREFHLAACSVRKPSVYDASRSRTSSSNSSDNSQPLHMLPPTPVSVRVRAPCTSYAAFVTRIEGSQSRLLDFEKDERWLGQVETMKGRVETLKRRNHIALAREVASTPRKSRSMSECSGVSTASTASLSSIDTPEGNCQQI
ncbi:hypothetical protein PRIC1_003661 [Phytophthora ramorum]|uniref:uncharacterized protein n=1 Tax=Phytophthora ramorum TaxID=164328 RepID=UPI003099FCA3|nr:hypothetical protein KRP23_3417 [Phytophthora ramorum]KAH7508254.1 hypothetical protein KRP22_3344 [Phytophthora ramorum]